MRTLELNPAVRFYIFGDARPAVAAWPSNCKFHRQTVTDVLERVRSRLGTAPRSLGGTGTTSKISDFKPMLGALYSDVFAGCGFWGYMQEDQLLGNLLHFLDGRMLSSFDTISPLPEPKRNAGPFMVYRNSWYVNGLYHLSADLQRVVSASEYQVFDEWWGPVADAMPSIIGREAAAGRLRAYTSNGVDGKWWLSDDYIYEGVGGAGTTSGESRASFQVTDETRRQDDDEWCARGVWGPDMSGGGACPASATPIRCYVWSNGRVVSA
jgi:hypothetical protein